MEQSDLKELRQRVDEVLYYLWDPIGINEDPFTRGEYRMYVDRVLSLLVSGSSDRQIADHLCALERQRMELTPNREQTLNVAKKLVEHAEAVERKIS